MQHLRKLRRYNENRWLLLHDNSRLNVFVKLGNFWQTLNGLSCPDYRTVSFKEHLNGQCFLSDHGVKEGVKLSNRLAADFYHTGPEHLKHHQQKCEGKDEEYEVELTKLSTGSLYISVQYGRAQAINQVGEVISTEFDHFECCSTFCFNFYYQLLNLCCKL